MSPTLLTHRSGSVPVQPDRDEARRLAEQELADPVYEDEPSLQERAITWLLDRVADLLDGAGALSPSSWLAVLALAALLVLVAVVVARRLRERARGDAGGDGVFAARTRTGAEHLAAADAAAARGDWATAVTERFRGAVRRLEERGVLDAVPGRTAEEVAHEAGARVSALAGGLRAAALRFDAVRYGGAAAGADDDAALRTLVTDLESSRLDRQPHPDPDDLDLVPGPGGSAPGTRSRSSRAGGAA